MGFSYATQQAVLQAGGRSSRCLVDRSNCPFGVPPHLVRFRRRSQRAGTRSAPRHTRRARNRWAQRVEKLLEDVQIKLSSVISDLFGVSRRAMLDSLAAGQRDPKALAFWPVPACAARPPTCAARAVPER